MLGRVLDGVLDSVGQRWTVLDRVWNERNVGLSKEIAAHKYLNRADGRQLAAGGKKERGGEEKCQMLRSLLSGPH